jgi:hypothetical protein
LAQSCYRRVETSFEIDKRVIRPKAPDQLIAADHFTRMCKKDRQYLKRLFLNSDAEPVFAQFPVGEVDFENSEPDDLGWIDVLLRHLNNPSTARFYHSEDVITRTGISFPYPGHPRTTCRDPLRFV